jgi:Xaa-Pro aminopeptidase
MRYTPIKRELFIENRKRLIACLPTNSLAVVNANDICATNADGSQHTIVNSDLFYLTGVEQEQSILLLYPDADEEKHRELLFLREPTAENAIWEGRKLTKAAARELTGIHNVHWLSDFPRLFHRLMCESDHVFLNSNEHKRAVIETETREARFASETMKKYPLHNYRRLAQLMHRLRVVKSSLEIELIRKACDLTAQGFQRVLSFTRPGVHEYEVEAEYSHEFIRHGGRFAYLPIIASGANACCLHYIANENVCQDGELLLMDVGASYANYNSDMTRTIPVNGRFTRRQRQVYDAVLGIMRKCTAGLKPGKKLKDWQKDAEQLTERELVNLGLLTMQEIKRQDPDQPAFKKHLMHGVGHPIGLDVHDVGPVVNPIEPGWVITVEPGIYIPKENFAVRLENTVLVTKTGAVDLMPQIAIEPEEIENLMQKAHMSGNGKSGNGKQGVPKGQFKTRQTAQLAR